MKLESLNGKSEMPFKTLQIAAQLTHLGSHRIWFAVISE